MFKFLRDSHEQPPELEWPEGAEKVRKAISEAMSARNIAFLLGAGCSSFRKDGVEVGITTMAQLAKEFCGETIQARAAATGFFAPPQDDIDDAAWDRPEEGDELGEDAPPPPLPPAPPLPWCLTREELDAIEAVGIELEEYTSNLERLAEMLFSQHFVFRQSSKKAAHGTQADLIFDVIEKLKIFLLARISDGAFAHGDTTVRDLYERFYKKLVLRDRSLPRPWVFTTNYDVFNETAMDRLAIPYANGFSGVIERRFNPASFRYALAEQFDIGDRKWAAVDAFVYLCKLHGSVSWTEDDHGLFPIREAWPLQAAGRMLIYPTPAKQNSSLASPYSDLFREFQFRIVREQSVLITVGYAFGDEHVNNIIYQALTIPTFRLIVFTDPESTGEIAKLIALRDPRIWIIGGDGPTAGTKAHYFDSIVEHFMPQRPSDRVDDAVRKVLSELAPSKKED